MNRIKQTLTKNNLTEQYLANILKVDTKQVQIWCNNKEQPPLNTLFKIARILKLNVDEIYNSTLK